MVNTQLKNRRHIRGTDYFLSLEIHAGEQAASCFSSIMTGKKTAGTN